MLKCVPDVKVGRGVSGKLSDYIIYIYLFKIRLFASYEYKDKDKCGKPRKNQAKDIAESRGFRENKRSMEESLWMHSLKKT